MTENEKKPQTPIKRLHSLMLDNNAKLTVSGVLSVKNYNDKEIVLILSDYILAVGGENLNLDKVNLEDGIVSIVGTVLTLRYMKALEKGGFFKRLVK